MTDKQSTYLLLFMAALAIGFGGHYMGYEKGRAEAPEYVAFQRERERSSEEFLKLLDETEDPRLSVCNDIIDTVERLLREEYILETIALEE